MASLVTFPLATLLLAACAPSSGQDASNGNLPALPPGAGYVKDIAKATRDNENYRRVLVTGPHMQLVLMTLRRGEEIGLETHGHGDQLIRVESGTGRATLNGSARPGTVQRTKAEAQH